MKKFFKQVPRPFKVGKNGITIKDCGDIYLEPDEQITFITESERRYDLARKDWGFYATPSVNGRLKNEGFKCALVKNEFNKIYVMVVEESKLDEFSKYCQTENQSVVKWLDEA